MEIAYSGIYIQTNESYIKKKYNWDFYFKFLSYFTTL